MGVRLDRRILVFAFSLALFASFFCAYSGLWFQEAPSSNRLSIEVVTSVLEEDSPVVLVVKDSAGNLISGAGVSFGSESVLSDGDGLASFVFSFGGPKRAVAQKQGYVSGSIDFLVQKKMHFRSEPSPLNQFGDEFYAGEEAVVFLVDSSGGVVAGASVKVADSFGERVFASGGGGRVSFEVRHGGRFTVSASKEGFLPVSSTMEAFASRELGCCQIPLFLPLIAVCGTISTWVALILLAFIASLLFVRLLKGFSEEPLSKVKEDSEDRLAIFGIHFAFLLAAAFFAPFDLGPCALISIAIAESVLCLLAILLRKRIARRIFDLNFRESARKREISEDKGFFDNPEIHKEGRREERGGHKPNWMRAPPKPGSARSGEKRQEIDGPPWIKRFFEGESGRKKDKK